MVQILIFAAGLISLTSTAAGATMTASSKCSSATFVTNPPAPYTCGRTGGLARKSVIHSIHTTVLGCANSCYHLSNCESFGFSFASGLCEMYDETLTQQGFEYRSAMEFWDVRCLACDSSALDVKAVSSTGKKSTSSFEATTSVTFTLTKSSSIILRSTKEASIVSLAGKSTSTSNTIPTCSATAVVVGEQTYAQFYSGSGKIQTPSNPGNDNSQEPAISTTLAGTYNTDCSAIQACASLAAGRSFKYYSFDLHYLSSIAMWNCVQYYDPNWKPGYFNITNTNVRVAYGYFDPDF